MDAQPCSVARPLTDFAYRSHHVCIVRYYAIAFLLRLAITPLRYYALRSYVVGVIHGAAYSFPVVTRLPILLISFKQDAGVKHLGTLAVGIDSDRVEVDFRDNGKLLYQPADSKQYVDNGLSISYR